MSSKQCVGSVNNRRWRPRASLVANGWVMAMVLGACNPDQGCEPRGTCADGGASLVTPDAAVSEPDTTTPYTTGAAVDAGSDSVTSHPLGGDGGASGTSSSPDSSSSSGDGGLHGCDPVSERGCGGDRPWCLGEAEALMANDLEAPRCVECEQDKDCAPNADSNELTGLCLDYECKDCEVGSNRGCGGGTPYCISFALEMGTVDAAAGRDSGLLEERAQVMQPQCVECLTEADCGAEAPACANHACVQCDRDAQCTDPSAPHCDTETNTCVGCTAVGQCARFDDTPACDVNNGVCVECTRAEQTKCDGQASGGFDAACVTIAVHPEYQTCSDQRREYSSQCTECVSDSQCRAGFRCVAETYAAPGNESGEETPTGKAYCMALESELEGSKACGDNRPFVGRFEATSEGGVAGVYCRPAYTTCSGYADWKTGPDAIADGDSGTKSTCTSDDSCGLPGVDDAYCVEFTATSNRCTYACSSEDDCPMPDSWCDMSSPPPGFNGACSVEPN